MATPYYMGGLLEEDPRLDPGSYFTGAPPMATSSFRGMLAAHEPRFADTLTPERLAEITATMVPKVDTFEAHPDVKLDRWARRGGIGSAPLLDIDRTTGVDILYPKGTTPAISPRLSPMPMMPESRTLDPMPMMPIPDPDRPSREPAKDPFKTIGLPVKEDFSLTRPAGPKLYSPFPTYRNKYSAATPWNLDELGMTSDAYWSKVDEFTQQVNLNLGAGSAASGEALSRAERHFSPYLMSEDDASQHPDFDMGGSGVGKSPAVGTREQAKTAGLDAASAHMRAFNEKYMDDRGVLWGDAVNVGGTYAASVAENERRYKIREEARAEARRLAAAPLDAYDLRIAEFEAAKIAEADAKRAVPTLDERLDVPDVRIADTEEVVSPSFLDSIISPAAAGITVRGSAADEWDVREEIRKEEAEVAAREARYADTLSKHVMSGGEFYEGSPGITSSTPDELVRAAKIAMGEHVPDLSPPSMEDIGITPKPTIRSPEEAFADRFREAPAATLEFEHLFGPDTTYTTISPEVRFGEDMYGKAPPTKYWGTTSDESRFGADEVMTTPITRVPALELEEGYYPGFSGSAPMPIASPDLSLPVTPPTPPTGSYELESYFPSLPLAKKGEEIYGIGRTYDPTDPIPGYKYLPSGELVKATRTGIGDWEFVGDPSYSSPGFFDTATDYAKEAWDSILGALPEIGKLPTSTEDLKDVYYGEGYGRDRGARMLESMSDPYISPYPEDPFPRMADPTFYEGPEGYSSITGTFYPTYAEIVAAEAAASGATP